MPFTDDVKYNKKQGNKRRMKVVQVRNFFTPIDPSFSLLFQHSEQLLSSFFSETPEGPFDRRIVLTDQHLIISNKKTEEVEPTHFLSLSHELLFQNLQHPRDLISKTPSDNAFSLINTKHQTVRLFFQFPSILELWLEKLANCINQLGFHEHYKIVAKIGKGSTSTVYKIKRRRDGKEMAAKVFLKSYIQSKPERRDSVNNEISLLRALDHKNILRIYGVFESNSALYVITQHLEGGTLIDRINQSKGINLEDVKKIMKGLAEGLAHMHRYGVMHRDIKLQNVMFRSKDSLEVVLVDFGLAAISEEQPYIFYRCGTPGYIAPEIITMQGNQRIDVICDVFSAGVILHILISNKYLFDGKDNLQVYKNNKSLSFDLQHPKYSNYDQSAMQLLAGMLNLDPQSRLSTSQLLQHPFLLPFPVQCPSKSPLSPAVTTSEQQFYYF